MCWCSRPGAPSGTTGATSGPIGSSSPRKDGEELPIGPDVAPVVPLGSPGLEHQHMLLGRYVKLLFVECHRSQLMLRMESCSYKSAS